MGVDEFQHRLVSDVARLRNYDKQGHGGMLVTCVADRHSGQRPHGASLVLIGTPGVTHSSMAQSSALIYSGVPMVDSKKEMESMTAFEFLIPCEFD